jgi:hypothetical protein
MTNAVLVAASGFREIDAADDQNNKPASGSKAVPAGERPEARKSDELVWPVPNE